MSGLASMEQVFMAPISLLASGTRVFGAIRAPRGPPLISVPVLSPWHPGSHSDFPASISYIPEGKEAIQSQKGPKGSTTQKWVEYYVVDPA